MDTKRAKPVVLPKFAAFLKKARRTAKKGGRKAIVKRAQEAGLTLVTLNRMKQVEAGTVSDVDPHFLQQLAEVYPKTPYSEMVSALVAEKFSLPLTVQVRHDSGVPEDTLVHDGGRSIGDVAATRQQTQGQYGFIQFRGEWIVDGQPGVTAVDMRNGHLWHLVAQNPSNSRVRPAVPMRPATYMGRYGFELVQENPE